MTTVTICSDFVAQNIKSLTVSIVSPFICHEVMRPDATILVFWAPRSLHMVTPAMKLKDACSLEESYDQRRQHTKKQRHYFANIGLSSQSYVFFQWSCMDVRVEL